MFPKVVFISAGKVKSNSYHRAYEPARWLINDGWDVHVLTFEDLNFNMPLCLSIMDRADVLNFHSTNIDMYNLMRRYKGRKLLIFDLDDAEYTYEDDPFLPMDFYFERIADYCFAMSRLADVTTVTTEHFANDMRREVRNTPILVLPNAIDYKLPMWNAKREEHQPFRFGYIGGQYSIRIFKKYRPELEKFMKMYPCEFHVCGLTAKQYPGDVIRREEFNGWNNLKLVEYGNFYSEIDAQFIFVNDEDPAGQFKSHLKLIEGAAYNLPIVCESKMPYRPYLDNTDVFLRLDDPHDLHAMLLLAMTQKQEDTRTRAWADAHFSASTINELRQRIFQGDR